MIKFVCNSDIIVKKRREMDNRELKCCLLLTPCLFWGLCLDV